MDNLVAFFKDRIQLIGAVIVLCFASVLTLSSQSGASYSTYFLALIMLFSIKEWNDVFSVRLMWLILALAIYLVLTAFWSDPFTWRGLLSVASRGMLVVFFVIAFAECQLRGQVQKWLGRTMAVVGSGATLTAIVVFLVTDPEDGRLNGLGQLDTHVIAALVFGTTLMFVLQMLKYDASRAWRVVAAISAVLIVAAVALSDSRNAWVSVAIGAVVLLVAERVTDRQRFTSSVVAIAFLASVALLALYLNETTREVLLPRGDSFRAAIWSTVLDRVADDGPWIGLGILTSDNIVAMGIEHLHPHSMYLAVLFQGGIVGVLLFGSLLLATLKALLENYDQPDAKLALGILTIALTAYMLDGHELIDKIGSTWFLIWLPVAIALGLRWNRPAQ